MVQIRSAAQFDSLLAGTSRVVVKVYADWCVDCRRIAKAYADVATGAGERAAFAELNADEVAEIAQRFDVRGIPAILVFQHGQPVKRLFSRDAKTAQQVGAFIEAALLELEQGTATAAGGD